MTPSDWLLLEMVCVTGCIAFPPIGMMDEALEVTDGGEAVGGEAVGGV